MIETTNLATEAVQPLTKLVRGLEVPIEKPYSDAVVNPDDVKKFGMERTTQMAIEKQRAYVQYHQAKNQGLRE